ncbi:MAG: twin-arginine translocase TatA/TatE family subunit [Helicobacteraceae bacterium]|jgi:sec-independent protein translocase protein TatA|nr:twin-arginine translocase TatA/TatE family subunit [Helicobacteraceae bacterium]
MGMPGVWEWALIFAVVLLLFGAKKIPELAKGLGSGIKNFKNAIKEDEKPLVDSATSAENSAEKAEKVA